MANSFEEQLLSAYVDGHLSPPERAQIEQRLKESPETQQLVNELLKIRKTVRALPRYTLEENLKERVLRQGKRELSVASYHQADRRDHVDRPPASIKDRSIRPFVWAALTTAAAALLWAFFDLDRAQETQVASKQESVIDQETSPTATPKAVDPGSRKSFTVGRESASPEFDLGLDRMTEHQVTRPQTPPVNGTNRSLFTTGDQLPGQTGRNRSEKVPRKTRSVQNNFGSVNQTLPLSQDKKSAGDHNEAILVVHLDVSEKSHIQKDFERLLSQKNIFSVAKHRSEQMHHSEKRLGDHSSSLQKPLPTDRDAQEAPQHMTTSGPNIFFCETTLDQLEDVFKHVTDHPDAFPSIRVEPMSGLEIARLSGADVGKTKIAPPIQTTLKAPREDKPTESDAILTWPNGSSALAERRPTQLDAISRLEIPIPVDRSPPVSQKSSSLKGSDHPSPTKQPGVLRVYFVLRVVSQSEPSAAERRNFPVPQAERSPKR